jgi:hypothetical protein
MEAIYKLNANEINADLMQAIKKLFGGKEITITITTEPDETTYLTMNPANEKHLHENIVAEPTITFSGDEFMKYVNKIDE